MPKGTNIKLMKEMNRSLVIRTVRSRGPLSRADIVKMTNLSPTAVSTIVSELMDYGLVREGQTGASSGGRKPIMLHFNPKAAVIIGVFVREWHMHGALLDLSGSPTFELEGPVARGNPDKFVSQLIALIGKLLAETRNTALPVLGAVIGVPGVLTSAGDTLLFSALLQMRDVPLQKTLQPHYSFPIRVINDVNLAALGEHAVGAGKGMRNMIYVWADSAIGAGIIADHKLHVGYHHSAGEFGHMLINPNGPLCNCGSHGCLATFCSEPGIVARAVETIKLGNDTVLVEAIDGDLNRLSIDTIVRSATAGDHIALDILQHAFTYLGYGVSNLFTLHDPEAVVVHSPFLDSMPEVFLRILRHTVKTSCLPSFDRKVNIIPATLGRRAGLFGMAELFFDSPPSLAQSVLVETMSERVVE